MSRTSYLIPSELQPSVRVINLFILYFYYTYYLKTQVVPQSKRSPPPLYSQSGNPVYAKIYCMLWGTYRGKAVPLQDWSGPEGSRKVKFPHFMTTAQDGGKVVSLTHRLLLPPENAHGIHFCAIGRILCQWKIPMTPAGIEPAIFQFVAQHLNHCATAVSIILLKL